MLKREAPRTKSEYVYRRKLEPRSCYPLLASRGRWCVRVLRRIPVPPAHTARPEHHSRDDATQTTVQRGVRLMEWRRALLALGLVVAGHCVVAPATLSAQDIACDRGDLEVVRVGFSGNTAFPDAQLANRARDDSVHVGAARCSA